MKFNKQKIFNKVVRHLLKQDCQATDEGGNCRYRGNDGTMCAVGCLIPDKLYSPSFEGLSAGTAGNRLNNVHVALIAAVGAKTTEDFDFLCQLQTIHDEDYTDEWPEEFRRFAARHRLKHPPALKKALKAMREWHRLEEETSDI